MLIMINQICDSEVPGMYRGKYRFIPQDCGLVSRKSGRGGGGGRGSL